MPTVTVNEQPFYVRQGARLCEALPPVHALDMPCAGKGRCGKCRVTAHGALSPPTTEERQHLSDLELAAGTRLACCARVEGDSFVTLEAAATAQIQLEGRLLEFPRDPLFTAYGAAVDLGTTTLSARLYSAAGPLAEAAAPNPQARFGADVISRIERALAGEGDALAQCIRTGIAALLSTLAAQAGIRTAQLDTLVITGNTAMLYLLTNTPPGCLSHAPFQADRLFGEFVTAESLGLPCPGARVFLPRCASAFVGADLTTAVLASGILDTQATCLLADIGTNGEMALWHAGQLLCCSTAAGPAFEGAGLSMGMPGRTGAIDHVETAQGALHAHVIGDAPPIGICGSGVIDALACLLDTGGMDETGRLAEENTVIAAPVHLTQHDIRMVQLAKSAICAGLQALTGAAGLTQDAIASLYIAGGFGSYLDAASAGRIGLIPPELVPRVRVLGNAALSGAAMLLLCKAFCERTSRFSAAARTLDLSTNPVFLAAYTEGMLFEG